MRWVSLLLALGACGDEPASDDVLCGEVAAPDMIEGGCGEVGEHCTISLGCGSQLPGCERWRGDIHVPDAFDEAGFEPIASLRRVDGTFSIFRPHTLTDFAVLDDLESVGGSFSIRLDSNGTLESLRGLEGLVEVGGLVIEHNTGLTDLRGLASLRVVRGDVHIRGNSALPRAEIDRLLACLTIDGTTTIEDNAP